MAAAAPDGPRRLLGVSSGTSADGIDLALVRVEGRGRARTVTFLAGEEQAYPAELRAAVADAPNWSLADVARMHHALGARFGEAARDFLARHAPDGDVAAIGCHGQTVFHHDGDPRDGTLQLGDAALVAAATGVPVVADFRWSDLALGGQGAPVSPYADWLLHGHAHPALALVNLGGIANVTLLRGEEPPLAWDSGPANGPLDALMRLEGGAAFDAGGTRTQRGTVCPALLAGLADDAFFARPLPRSTGLERFGADFARAMRESEAQASLEDLLATAAALAARALADSLAAAGWSGGPLHLAGGGARNAGLVAALEAALPAAELRSYGELGWDADLREAVAFALLAEAHLAAEPASWPSTTGVGSPAVLGRWVPPPRP